MTETGIVVMTAAIRSRATSATTMVMTAVKTMTTAVVKAARSKAAMAKMKKTTAQVVVKVKQTVKMKQFG